MAIENGSAFLLKIGDGAIPPAYRTVAGLRTTLLSVNGEAVNVTTKDSAGWRDLLSGAGVRSVSVSAAGIFTGSDAEVRLRGHALARSEEHTSELQSLMRTSYAVSGLKQNNKCPCLLAQN